MRMAELVIAIVKIPVGHGVALTRLTEFTGMVRTLGSTDEYSSLSFGQTYNIVMNSWRMNGL